MIVRSATTRARSAAPATRTRRPSRRKGPRDAEGRERREREVGDRHEAGLERGRPGAAGRGSARLRRAAGSSRTARRIGTSAARPRSTGERTLSGAPARQSPATRDERRQPAQVDELLARRAVPAVEEVDGLGGIRVDALERPRLAELRALDHREPESEPDPGRDRGLRPRSTRAARGRIGRWRSRGRAGSHRVRGGAAPRAGPTRAQARPGLPTSGRPRLVSAARERSIARSASGSKTAIQPRRWSELWARR